MATDLRIELFSVDFFRNLWYSLGLTDIIMPRHKNYNAALNEYAYSRAILEAVNLRREYFQFTLDHKLFKDYEAYSASSIDFYMYLQHNMNMFIAYDELDVFDRLFMTCAVVAKMVYVCWVNMNRMHFNTASLCWAMYFDTTSKDEFYNEGGWEGLKLFAENINKKLIDYYTLLDPGKPQYENDFLNAQACFDQLSYDYSIPQLRSVFKNKMQSYKLSCSDCRNIFYAIEAVFIEYDNDLNEYQYCECYLQIMKHMLPQEELKKSCDTILKDPEMKQIAEVFDVVLNPTKGASCELLKDKLEFYQKVDIYKEKYKALNNLKFLDSLFIPNSELNDNQCIFCCSDLINLEDNLKLVNNQTERIKSVICQTVIDVYENNKSKMLPKAGNYQNWSNDGTNDALRMFFALGVEAAIPGVLANLEREKDYQNEAYLTNPCAEKHIKKVPEDKKKEVSVKKKKSKKKKSVK